MGAVASRGGRAWAALLAVALLLGLVGGCAPRPAEPLPLVEVTIGAAKFVAEAPQDDVDRNLGLGGRADLPPGRGMVFIFEPAKVAHMHMGRMLFSLDFVFCRDGRVSQIVPDVGHADPDTTVVSSAPADFVLELPAGLTDRLGLRVGDSARLRWLSAKPG